MKFAGALKFLTLSAFLTTCFAGNAFSAVEYTLHKSENPTEDELDAYQRITTVMDSAVYLYNKYTNLSKYINVYYAPGVPTAEASSNGDLRFGKERSYMFVGTAMHEMAHTMGMGTTSEYKAMMDGGVFKGEKAQALLKEIDGPEAELHGDSQHFWPYGLNYASEVKSEQDLINHARIVEAMYQDIFKEAFRTLCLAGGADAGENQVSWRNFQVHGNYLEQRARTYGLFRFCDFSEDFLDGRQSCYLPHPAGNTRRGYPERIDSGGRASVYLRLQWRCAPEIFARRCYGEYSERIPPQELQEWTLPAVGGNDRGAESEGLWRRFHLAADRGY